MDGSYRTNLSDLAIPTRLGRYKILEQLGSGSLGAVFESRDEELRRDVAIKVPHPHWLTTTDQIHSYLSVMRHIASLDHPGIVPLYDSGRTEDGLCYLVSKLMSAGSLEDLARSGRLSPARSVRLIHDIARTLHDAHRKELVHRNLKPTNILFDDHYQPCITDFGMPLPDASLPEVDIAEAIQWLAPEQLRIEMHRVDARTDIYSLGLILYWLLSGRLPFPQQRLEERLAAAQRAELADLATPGLPAELIRVCQRATSRRMGDRYSTALEFADELEHCLAVLSDTVEKLDTPSRDDLPRPVRTTADLPPPAQDITEGPDSTWKVVPKGLRSFDREDAEFFLELVPGPRGRDGLPESIRFWKQHLEQNDPELTFAVGLIYGPSGCGKSSLVKAGLLPRLQTQVIPIYVEATPDETEKRLLTTLRKRFSQLPQQMPLIETLAELRRGHGIPAGTKVVLILDQFEQWLHSSREIENPELARALRQCDGRHLQAVIMVRDDFWMAVTRFMHKLEVRLIEGKNSAAIDLFSPQHARKVLIAFGRAYGCLPEREEEFSSAELEFLQDSINGLTNEGKVNSVQLSLFADMVKHKPWVPSTLRDVGGTAGIGVAFLEETFSGAHAPPAHRRHQSAARAVLKELLPDHGTDIKGRMHAREQLLLASGYSGQPQEFDELIQLLDHELRLVTPADPDGSNDANVNRENSSSGYYQLTHDYLVLSIRRWLVHKQQETMRGRAELLLADVAATWSQRREARFLPSIVQWLRIRLLTARRDRSRSEQALMRAAGRYYTARLALVIVICAATAVSGYAGLQYIHAQTLRDRLLFASTAEVPKIIAEIDPYKRWTRPLFQDVIAQRAAGSREALHARLALLEHDAAQVDPVFERTLDADDATYPILMRALIDHRQQLSDRLWKVLADENADHPRRLRAAMLLAQFDPPSKGKPSAPWVTSSPLVAQFLLEATVTDPTRFQALVESLDTTGALLVEPLRQFANDDQRSEAERSIASNLFIHFASDQPDLLVEMLLSGGSSQQQAAIIEKLIANREHAVSLLTPIVQGQTKPLQNGDTDTRQSNVDPANLPRSVMEMLAAGAGLATDDCAFCQTLTLPEFTNVSEQLQAAGYRPIRLRPYQDGEVLRIAAAWTRDGREGIFRVQNTDDVSDLNSTQVLQDISTYRSGGERQHAFVWMKKRDGDPRAEGFVGFADGRWQEFLRVKAQEELGVSAIDFSPVAEEGMHFVTAVFSETRTTLSSLLPPARYERELTGESAGKLQMTVDISIVPTQTYHGMENSRRHFEIQSRGNRLKTDPNDVEAIYHTGWAHFYLGDDRTAIEYFSRYLETPGSSSDVEWRRINAHTMRYVAAARAGDERSQDFLDTAIKTLPLDADSVQFWKAMGGIAAGSGAPEQFEEYASPRFPNGIVLRQTATQFGWAAGAAKRTGDSDRAERYIQRAIEYLRRAFQVGEYPAWLFNELWLADIMDDPRLQRLQWETEIYNLPVVPLVRQGAFEGARTELARFLESSADVVQKMRVETVTLAYLGQHELAARKIESAIAAQLDDDYVRYWGACTSLLALAELVKPENEDASQQYSSRVLELLRERVYVHDGANQVAFRRELMSGSAWFVPLRTHPEFQSLAEQLSLQYSASFAARNDLESRGLHGLDPQQHLEQCRALAEQGWRLAAIDVCVPAGASVPISASVWHRARYSEIQRNQFASRMAAAGVALLRLGRPELVWPLLEHSPDPQIRTNILALVEQTNVDPEAFAIGLRQTTSPGIRRSMLLALGSYAPDRFTVERRQELITTVQHFLRNDADPGVHSACQWLLSSWGHLDALASAERELQSDQPPANRRWQANSLRQTLIRIEGPVEFEMGTPSSDVEGEADEASHRRQIPRSFEISSTEVTVEQFKRFLDEHPQISHPARQEPSSTLKRPVTSVTFYQAAQFCRWLSEQDDVPEDEMVYPPVGEIGPAMLLRPYPLSRAGYRLPTEAEWEYACRAGTSAPRHFGTSQEHVLKFGWFKNNAQSRLWPVGSLLPNDLGFFDMYGNAEEMCAEHVQYPRRNSTGISIDERSSQLLPEKMSVRGRSILSQSEMSRSADRYDYGQLGYKGGLTHVGFRVARTLPAPEIIAAREKRDRVLGEITRRTAIDQPARDAHAAYERMLSLAPANQDLAWEFSEFLLDESSAISVNENVSGSSESGGNSRSNRMQQWRYHLTRSSLNGFARLACARMLRGEADLAARALDRAGANPGGTELRDLFLLSLLCKELERTNEAERFLTTAMARWADQDADDSMLRLAADALEITTQQQPTEPAGLARRARLLMRVDTEAAARVYDQAFELSADPKILIARARFYSEIGELERAEADFKKAADLNASELDRFLQAGWWIAGPFPPGSATEGPQRDPDPTKTYLVGGQSDRVKWQAVTPDALGDINLKPIFDDESIAIYALTYVYSPDDRSTLFVAGVDDSMRVWVNGALVGEALKYNINVLDPPLVLPIHLQTGKNTILVKVENGIFDYRFHARLGDHPLSRSQWLSRIGLWNEAAPLFERTLANGRFSTSDRRTLEYQWALTLVATGQLEPYYQLCQTLSDNQSFDAASGTYLALRLAVLAPNAVDSSQLQQLATRLSTEQNQVEQHFYYALAFYRLGKYSDALASLQNEHVGNASIKSRVLSALIHRKLGDTDLAREHFDAAKTLYDQQMNRLREQCQNHNLPVVNWEDIAEQIILLREARVEIAREDAKDSLDDTLADCANQWRQSVRRDVEAYDQAVQLFPRDSRSYRNRALQYTRLTRLDEAAADYFKALTLNSHDQLCRRELFSLLPRLGDASAALSIFLDTSGNTPQQPEYWQMRADALMEIGRKGDAVADYARALDMYPDDLSWNSPRSRAVLKLARSADIYHELLERRNAAKYLRLGRARYLITVQNWSEAAKEYQTIIDDLPLDSFSYCVEYAAVLALAEEQEKYQQFIASLRNRMSVQDSRQSALVARASSLLATSGLDPTDVTRLGEAGAREGGSWQLHVSALALLRANRISESERQLQVSLESKDWDAREQSLNHLLSALIAAQKGDYATATQQLDIANHSSQLSTTTWNPADWLEFVLLRREAEAMIHAKSVQQLTADLEKAGADRGKILERRAELYAQLHNWSAAAEDYGALALLDDQRLVAVRKQASMFVQLHDWRRAADCLELIVQEDLRSDFYIDALRLMSLLSMLGDNERHAALRARLLTDVEFSTDPYSLERAAKGAAVLPAPADQTAQLVAAAERAVTLDPSSDAQPWTHVCRALAAYRIGDYEGALDWCARSLEFERTSPMWYRQVAVYVVEAMSQKRLGRLDLAHSALEQAENIYGQQNDRQLESGYVFGDWHDWLICTVLMREARAMMGTE